MKTIIFSFVFIISSVVSFSQDMVIQKNDGSNIFIDLNNINKINFRIPCPGTPTVDYAGKTYHTISIGGQCWLTENINVGDMIPGVNSQSDNGTIEKYCYNDDPNNCDIYGGLYIWSEAMQYVTPPGAQGICPEGWHIPTRWVPYEFDDLASAVDNDGYALIEIGQGSGTNTSGFSAFMAGNRHYSGIFQYLGLWTKIWSSNTDGTGNPQFLQLFYNSSIIYLGEESILSTAYSVRCIKD